MSIHLMTAVWGCELAQNEQAVALALADWGNDDGSSIFPSVARIAWKTGYSDRQVRRILRGLESRELLVVVTKATRHRPTEYRMITTAVPQKPPFRADILSPLEPSRADTEGSQGGHPGSPRPDIAMSPEPSKEPSVKNHQSREAPASRKRDEIFEAVVQACYPRNNGLTQTARGRANRAAKELKEVGATVEEIELFSMLWPSHFPGAQLTPQAMTGNWALLDNGDLFTSAKKGRR